MRSRFAVGALLALLVVGALLYAVFLRNADADKFSYRLDPGASYARDVLPGLSGGPPRIIGTMIEPSGHREDFALDEVVMRAADKRDVESVISTYGGKILRSGRAQPIEGLTPAGHRPGKSGLVLIKIDLDRSDLGDMRQNMEDAGVEGRFTFSSVGAARLVSLLAREEKLWIAPNTIVRGQDSKEHPTDAGDNLDAETWVWMTDDDVVSTPDTDDGLSVGVTRAWDYLYYKDVLGQTGERVPTYGAIIDGGFALNDDGVPRDGNKDFFYYGAKPLQADLVDNDGTAGGENRSKCTGGTSCPWHGQGAFGVLGAVPRNAYGSAGIGGPVVVPILIRADSTWYELEEATYRLSDAIRAAALFGAGRNRPYVISVSSTQSCNTLCGLSDVAGPEDLDEYMQRTVLTATAFGAVVIATAGNDTRDLDEGTDLIPCELNAVICVGAITNSGGAQSYSNYGANVDIWAPTNILSTSDPKVAGADTDNVCDGATSSSSSCDELQTFGGTSASTPFVAGVVALMAALDSNTPSSGELPPAGTQRVNAIRSILRDTANGYADTECGACDANDPKVTPGYVDALRAVMSVRANLPPTVTLVQPTDGTQVGWKHKISFKATYSDPEVDPDEIYQWAGKVTYSSDRDGVLCESSLPPYSCTTELTPSGLTVGAHRITVTAEDPFGGLDSQEITVQVVNQPPNVEVTSPTASQVLYSDVPTTLNAYVTDPDETIDWWRISWSSSLDGELGKGFRRSELLTAGTHVVKAVAVDGKGLSASDEVTVRVRSGAGLPSPTIVYPGPNDPCCFDPGHAIVLQGKAVDEEDGQLPGSALRWYSDIDGFLGTGRQLQVTLSEPEEPCFPEYRRHQVKLVARDSDGNRVSVSRQISIGYVC